MPVNALGMIQYLNILFYFLGSHIYKKENESFRTYVPARGYLDRKERMNEIPYIEGNVEVRHRFPSGVYCPIIKERGWSGVRRLLSSSTYHVIAVLSGMRVVCIGCVNRAKLCW